MIEGFTRRRMAQISRYTTYCITKPTLFSVLVCKNRSSSIRFNINHAFFISQLILIMCTWSYMHISRVRFFTSNSLSLSISEHSTLFIFAFWVAAAHTKCNHACMFIEENSTGPGFVNYKQLYNFFSRSDYQKLMWVRHLFLLDELYNRSTCSVTCILSTTADSQGLNMLTYFIN